MTVKTIKVIVLLPTILIPRIQYQSSPIVNPNGGSHANYKLHHGFQRKSTKAQRQTRNAVAVAVVTIKHSIYKIYMGTRSKSNDKSSVVH